ncbi:MAG: MAC/perforin domain-containing protein, partial [Gammaproteobacteria bacterium]
MFTIEYIATHRLQSQIPCPWYGPERRNVGETGFMHGDGSFEFKSSPFKEVIIESAFRGTTSNLNFYCANEREAIQQLKLSFNIPNTPNVNFAANNSSNSAKRYQTCTFTAYNQSIVATIENLSDEAKSLLDQETVAGNRVRYHLTERFINRYGTHFISRITLGAYYCAEVSQEKKKSFFSFQGGVIDHAPNVAIGAETNASTQYEMCDISGLPDGLIAKVLTPGEKIARFSEVINGIRERSDTTEALDCLSFKFSSWEECGLWIEQEQALVPTANLTNLPSFKMILDRIIGREEDRYSSAGLDFNAAAFELLNSQIIPELKEKLMTVFFSQFAFPLALALSNIPNNRGLNFLFHQLPDDSAFRTLILNLRQNNVISIMPYEHESRLMMDRTYYGFVRLP